jgi:hypothetical protein
MCKLDRGSCAGLRWTAQCVVQQQEPKSSRARENWGGKAAATGLG